MAQEKTVLDVTVHDVIRVLPADQRNEIYRYDRMLAEAFQHLEYGKYFARRDTIGLRHGRAVRYTDDIAPRIVMGMAERDLELADQYGFQMPTPSSIMAIRRKVGGVAAALAAGTTDEPREFAQTALGLTGLHVNLIGSVEVLNDETAEESLVLATNALATNVVRPLFNAYASYQSSRAY